MRSFVTLSRRTPRLDPATPVALTDRGRRTAHLAASVLLGYPDAATRAAAPDVRRLLDGLPATVATPLARFCDVLDAASAGPRPDGTDPAADLEARYVETFDLRRQCSMYLSYYAAGDTRRRGGALVGFVEAYRAAGWELASDELPDYLPTVLELSARSTGDDALIAAGLLGSHRDGIEVLRSALAHRRSPWADVVEAVCRTLPPLDPETEARYTELVTAGPPAEMVGLSAFGPLEPFRPGGSSAGEPSAPFERGRRP